jgi:hypothetical protein
MCNASARHDSCEQFIIRHILLYIVLRACAYELWILYTRCITVHRRNLIIDTFHMILYVQSTLPSIWKAAYIIDDWYTHNADIE